MKYSWKVNGLEVCDIEGHFGATGHLVILGNAIDCKGSVYAKDHFLDSSSAPRIILDISERKPKINNCCSGRNLLHKVDIKWITRFGISINFLTDQTRNLEATLFKVMCKVLGVTRCRKIVASH